MSPTQFPFDPTKARASMEVFPKGEYEVVLGDAKGFIRQAGKDKHDSYGVRFNYKITGVPEGTSTEYIGKTGTHSIYHHSKAAGGMAKQFLIAGYGYGKGNKEEQRFDKDFADADFNVDYETGTVGDFYRGLAGKRVMMTTEPGKNPETGEENNNAKGWRALS